MAALTYFEVTGHYWSVDAPLLSGNSNDPEPNPVEALVTFTPRLPAGFTTMPRRTVRVRST